MADSIARKPRLTHHLTSISHILRISVAPLLGVALLLGGKLEHGLGAFNLLALLVAGLMVALSLLTAFELLRGSNEHGGTYSLVAATRGGIPSFLTGWLMISAQLVLVAALMRAAGVILAEVISFPFDTLYLSLVLAVVLLLAQLFSGVRQIRVRDVLLTVAGLGLIALLIGVVFSDVWSLPLRISQLDAGDLWRQSGRFAVLYLAVESTLSVRRRIRQGGLSVFRSISTAFLVGLALLSLPLIVLAGLPDGSVSMWTLVSRATVLPSGLAVVLELTLILLSAQFLTAGASRGLYEMSLKGGLPRNFVRSDARFQVSPVMVGVMGVIMSVSMALGQHLPLLDTSAAMLLCIVLVLNLTGIYSRRVEPDRRRSLVLPFYPLIPSIAAGLALALLINLDRSAQLTTFGWLTAGILLFFTYSRRQLVAAQEGVSRFGTGPRPDKPRGTYRILVPLAPDEPGGLLLDLALSLAKQLGGDVVPLQVIPVPDPLAMEEAYETAQESNRLFRVSIQEANSDGIEVHPTTRLARTVPDGIIDTAKEEECDLLLLPWIVHGDEKPEINGSVLDPVISRSPCDTAVVAYRPVEDSQDSSGQPGEPPLKRKQNILLPSAGGPHAPLAALVASTLARHTGAKLTAVYVGGTDSTPAEIEAGRARIRATFDSIHDLATDPYQDQTVGLDLEATDIEARVILSDDVVEAIAQASQEADLAVIGGSEESLIDRVFFGSLPLKIASACQVPVIMVRRHRGLLQFWMQRFWDTLSQAFPTLDSEDQIETYKRIQRGAEPDMDFFVMMGLSTTIGTIGLLLNSGAVIIGAMLVAPLLTPFLTFSLAVATGDFRLVRLAVESSLKGVFLAIGLAVAIASLAPFPTDPIALPEIASRTQPNLLDLGVALAAGAAGAYALGRKEVAAALPGVAISAALVPPLAVVGIGLATGEFDHAAGAALLVLTNLFAITLAGAITLLLLGFRPSPQHESKMHLRTGLVATALLSALIFFPLTTTLTRGVRRSSTEQVVATTLERQFENIGDARVVDVQVEEADEVLEVLATVHLSGEVQDVRRLPLVAALESQTDRSVDLSLLLIPLLELDNDDSDSELMFDWRNRNE